MLLCTKNLGCNKLDGHRSPCEKRVVKITPELVTISYRKDGKDYLLSIPSDHAEWAEEMLNLDREAIERAAAERAWDRCVGEMPIDPDWKNFYADNNPYRAAALGLTAEQEGEAQ